MSVLDQIMGVQEASQLWGLSPDHIKKLCRQRKVISRNIGNTWIIVKDQPNPKGGRKMKIYYEDILVGEVMTNRSLSVDEALQLIGFDEQSFLSDNQFDDIDYNEFKMVY